MNKPERPPGYIPKMRTVAGIVEEIKKIDPDTGITAYYIRGLLKDGKLPYRCAGKKRLINLEDALDAIYAAVDVETPETADPKPQHGIRPVDVRNPMGK